MVDKLIKKEFSKLRKEINESEARILRADIKADKERDRLKRKLKKL